ncbi:hypothetical protein N1M2_134 [Klebsiella phage N1M2]|uniref:Uncharacterized protein n=1 Tax=Klebsiella phage N1M2 TaxID=2664939 RepID=A0A6B7ZET0_9CAUD|nr:hypothetical protein PQB72_gp134 [Klebsiella phage N1M2]QGH71997.1 hypothetical protein N1M2_134 [Klebsiella phage N1M2]
MSRKKKRNSFNPAVKKTVAAIPHDVPIQTKMVDTSVFDFYQNDEVREEDYRINYSPFISGVSVNYTGFRFKQNHVIKLKTGEITRGRPNADAWYLEDGRTVYDPEVERISLIPDGLDRKYSFTGEGRVVRDIQMFGTKYPVYCGETFYYPSQIPEDKKIVVFGAFAYRYQSGVKFKIIPVTGMIVDKDDPRPGLDVLLKYEEVDINLMWGEHTGHILNTEELINRIKWVHRIKELERNRPDDFARAVKLAKENGIPEASYTLYIPALMDMPVDKVMETYNLMNAPLDKGAIYPTDPMEGAKRANRGPYTLGQHDYIAGKVFEVIKEQ